MITKETFDTIVVNGSASNKELQALVLQKVPIFQDFSTSDKDELMKQLEPIFFVKNSYICRQGAEGDAFYIILEGSCAVSIYDSLRQKEMQLTTLHPGDFFGEKALIAEDNIRSASVVALENVNCMVLKKRKFTQFLPKFQKALLNYETALKDRSSDASRGERRRITGFDDNNVVSPVNSARFLQKIAQFMTLSLWRCMYSQYYQALLLRSDAAAPVGLHAERVCKGAPPRREAVQSLMLLFSSLYTVHISQRNKTDHELMLGLLQLKSRFSESMLAGWNILQLTELSKRVFFQRVRALQTVMEASTGGTKFFVILRGSIRIFSQRLKIREEIFFSCHQSNINLSPFSFLAL